MTVINLINVSSIAPTTVAGAITTSRAAIIDVAADKVAKVKPLVAELPDIYVLTVST